MQYFLQKFFIEKMNKQNLAIHLDDVKNNVNFQNLFYRIKNFQAFFKIPA